MNYKQPFVYCGVCHTDYSSNDKVTYHLTSCAHILCSDHLDIYKSQNYINSNQITCPICKNENISTLIINDNLPKDLKTYFKPFPMQLEILFANSQFQYIGLIEKIQYQKDLIDKLNNKNIKLKDLLIQAKNEIISMDNLKYTNQLLLNENINLKNELNKRNGVPKTVPIPITREEVAPQQLMDHQSFVQKIQKFSSMKKLGELNNNTTNTNTNESDTQNPKAESTSLKSYMEKSLSSNNTSYDNSRYLINDQNQKLNKSLQRFNPVTKRSSNCRSLSLRPPTISSKIKIDRILNTGGGGGGGGSLSSIGTSRRGIVISGGNNNSRNRIPSASNLSSPFFKK
ncbi:hypothetical protein CANARDRAFT_174713 [[Candida] arabinofermentans NRRL YB-2248]|uniref:RING-type domain-containing protein n=1 Tax=[Candida] arabinofermentans NRRL YB-2248 TaxID=983967 RepID=A0A1E4T4F7_9ASCO|nr:hypothetical protein CANARDRAFT_174713 [[Candida] arabinofermentans NRRL YB-2248]